MDVQTFLNATDIHYWKTSREKFRASRGVAFLTLHKTWLEGKGRYSHGKGALLAWSGAECTHCALAQEVLCSRLEPAADAKSSTQASFNHPSFGKEAALFLSFGRQVSMERM